MGRDLLPVLSALLAYFYAHHHTIRRVSLMAFSALLQLMERQSFREGKYALFEQVLPTLASLSVDDIVQLMKTFSFDHEKTTMIGIIVKDRSDIMPKWTADDLQRLLRCFSFDENRNKALAKLQPWLDVPLDTVAAVLDTYSFDPGRNEAVTYLVTAGSFANPSSAAPSAPALVQLEGKSEGDITTIESVTGAPTTPSRRVPTPFIVPWLVFVLVALFVFAQSATPCLGATRH